MTTEIDVGISAFINPDKPVIHGIIKHKFYDFLVNEISEDDSVVHLSSEGNFIKEEIPSNFINFIEDKTKIFFIERNLSPNIVAEIGFMYPNLDIVKKGNEYRFEKTNKRKIKKKYFRFTLCKMNISQAEAVNIISKTLSVSVKDVDFAGNKDKRAITTQHISVSNCSFESLQKLVGCHCNIKCGDFQMASDRCKLGDLNGNRFSIVLRDIKLDNHEMSDSDLRELIHYRVMDLSNKGFINYFGMQRFGTGTVATHIIGRELFKGNFREVIKLLFLPNEGDCDRSRKAKEILKNKNDPSEALKLMPRKYSAERSVLIAMKEKNSTDLKYSREFFDAIERRTRMLYLHAYQSYLWNMVASKRAKEGLFLMEGDNVLDKSTGKTVSITTNNIRKYDIFDLVIELPSEHTTNQVYINLLSKDGLTTNDLRFPGFKVESVQRHIFVLPGDLRYTVVRHNDLSEQLIQNDMDIISHTQINMQNDPNGKYLSLALFFSLDSGSYATMLLREFLNRSTEWFIDHDMSAPKSFGFLSLCFI